MLESNFDIGVGETDCAGTHRKFIALSSPTRARPCRS